MGMAPGKKKKKFDPESSDYDMDSAVRAGMAPNPETKHWSSRVPNGPNEGLLLKGRKHHTWDLLEKGEAEAGYEIYKGRNGRYYSRKKATK